MPQYEVNAHVTISISTKVQAETEEQAIEIAKNREMMEIIPDVYYTDDRFWVISVLDGEPTNIRIEEQ